MSEINVILNVVANKQALVAKAELEAEDQDEEVLAKNEITRGDDRKAGSGGNSVGGVKAGD